MKHFALALAAVALVITMVDASSMLSINTKYNLRDGGQMPAFGLGVYMSNPGDETYNACSWALSLGYRLIDTAAMYQNEASVGKAVADSGIPRSKIFITTKLNTPDHGYEATLAAVQNSLHKLDTSYIDLVLIHSPYGGKLIETWDALLALKREGLIRSVGVSNFGLPHLRALKQHGREMPAVNQFEMHPLIYQERQPLLDLCKAERITITAYGSLFYGQQSHLNTPAIVDIAKAHGKTTAQVLLRWGLQMGFAIIPKSVSSKARQAQNMDIFDFDLSEGQIRTLSELQGTVGTSGSTAYWNPVDEADVDIGSTDYGEEEGAEPKDL